MVEGLVQSAAAPAVMEFHQVTKTYTTGKNSVLALEDISFTIPNEESGEFVALLGPSGSGKSTILNMISGLLSPSTGSLSILGKKITGPTEDAVTVQQQYTCFPWRTVLGNVEFGLEILGITGSEKTDRAMEYIKRVGLGDRGGAYPKELSGGMQQRVALARALALKRPILLMDEPFGALDAQTRADMQQMLMNIWSEEKNTIFFITHDISEAVLMADRILVLSPRPARVVHDVMIPFERPRPIMIQTEPRFAEIVQALLQVLRSAERSAGQGG